MENAENAKLRRVKTENLPAFLNTIAGTSPGSEVWKPDTIKVQNKEDYFILPSATAAKGFVRKESFFCVILAAAVAYTKDLNNDDGPKIERRVLSVLRTDNGAVKGSADYVEGALYPEIMWLNPRTGIPEYQKVLKPIKDKYHAPVYGVLVEVTVEIVKGTFTYSKPVFRVVRTLDENEFAYTTSLAEACRTRNAMYVQQEDLSAYEEEMMGITTTKAEPTEVSEAKAVARAKDISREDEEEDEAPPKPTKKVKTEEPPAEKRRTAPMPVAEDEEDDVIARAKAKKAAEASRATVADDFEEED